MDRTLDPTYQRARDRLEAILDAQGFRLASENHLPEAFGSAEAEYKRRGLRVQLTWDGRDRWLWLKVAPVQESPNTRSHPSTWRDLETVVNAVPVGAYLQGDAIVERRIKELERALKAYLSAAG